MYTVISDYDGTIKTFDKNPNFIEKYTFKNNIKSINEFIKKDNKFIIATGRDSNSIIEETKKFNINYNYLITYNGRVILDKNNNLLYANYINNDDLKRIKKEIEINKTINFDEYGYTESENNLIYARIKIEKHKNIKKLLLEWKKEFSELSIDYNIFFRILTIRNKFNKSLGIKELNKIDKLNNIFTIGDETNDIEMLKDYNGYRMLISNPKLISVTNKSISSVHKLIKKLN